MAILGEISNYSLKYVGVVVVPHLQPATTVRISKCIYALGTYIVTVL